ncbi:thiamine phosphate synthase [Nautilia sp.]
MLKYFITDPEYSLKEIFEAIKKHRPDFVCYRNKKYFDKEEIIRFNEFAKNNSKTVINYDSLKQDPELADIFDAIHFPSYEIDEIKNFPHKTVIVSTHSPTEVKKALSADFITFSPVFDSKGRKGAGIETLNRICSLHPNVIALGGILGKKEIEEIKKSKAAGFAAIRYFFT